MNTEEAGLPSTNTHLKLYWKEKTAVALDLLSEAGSWKVAL